MEKMEVLRQYFGFSSFREGQQTLIDAVLAGRDVLGVMPTGGGKSLCYELPALLLPGLTLVVSPLISLMKDQVMALRSAGIPAGCINSAMSMDELREAYTDARYGAYKLLYVAPERLLTDGFCALAQELEIPLVAVDEAHCISQWGQDFRPSYLKIVEFLQQLPRRPAVAAFTATATAQVRSDISRILQLREPETVVTGFDRPNLRFEVLRPRDKRTALLQLLSERRDKSGIVYCATRKTVEQVCGFLQEAGFAATRYHAGLDAKERRENQEAFICDRSPVMAATNAFGMGIERVLMLLDSEGVVIPKPTLYDVFVTYMGAHQVEAFSLVQKLRDAGIKADMDHTGRSLKAQFKYANKMGATLTATLGDEEIASGVVKVKNMATKEEQTIALDNIADGIRNMLG